MAKERSKRNRARESEAAVQTTFRLTPSEMAALKAAVGAHAVSQSELVRRALVTAGYLPGERPSPADLT